MMTKTFAFILLALVSSATAQAQTVVLNNLSNNQGTANSTGTSVGQSFLTGATTLNLDDVVFPQMGGSAASGYTNNYYSGEAYTLYGNVPTLNTPDFTTPLGSFSLTNNIGTNGLPAAPGAAGYAQTTAVPTTPITLSASTRYWLVLSTGTTATAGWTAIDAANFGYNEANNYGVTVATGTHTAYKTVGTGATATTTYYSYTQGPQQIYIIADAVPEPSSLGLLAVAGAGAFLLVRRVRSAKVA